MTPSIIINKNYGIFNAYSQIQVINKTQVNRAYSYTVIICISAFPIGFNKLRERAHNKIITYTINISYRHVF